MLPALFPLLDAPVAVGPIWNFHLEAIAPLVLVEAIYLFALTRMHRRSPDTRPISDNQVLLFTIGILIIYAAVGTPLDELADHYWLSAHMLQHLIIGLVAPIFLLLGLPSWFLRALLLRPSVFPVAYVLTRPLIAFCLFNIVLVFIHLPVVMSLELANEYTVHAGAHLLLIGTGMLMWWPVLGSVPELPGLSPGLQLVYLFAQSFVPTVLSAFVIFTDTPIYPAYEMLPRLFGLPALADQRIGGLIMKLGGDVVLWGAGTVIFFKWFNAEERDEPAMPPAPPDLQWKDVEGELVRMGLTAEQSKPKR